MDSAYGRRGSVVNVMSSHLFLLESPVLFTLRAKATSSPAVWAGVQKVATSRTPAHTAKM